MATSHSFKTVFAVPMACDSCVQSVSEALLTLEAVTSVDASLPDQLVTVEGTAAPSALVQAIQATGRDAILRGSGDPNSAAVSILESYADLDNPSADITNSRNVKGLARMVQVSPSTTLVDLTVSGVSPGSYHASVRTLGNLKQGALSTGPVWRGAEAGATADPTGSEAKGSIGVVSVGADGRGALFVARPFAVWEIIGRSVVLAREGEELMNGTDTLVGVVARSAGAWDNDKLVCSCTGKTLWDERAEHAKAGVL